MLPDAAPDRALDPGQRHQLAGHPAGVAGDVDEQRHDPQQDDRRQGLAPERATDPRRPSGVGLPAPPLGDLPRDHEADDRWSDIGPGPFHGRRRPETDAGHEPPWAAEGEAPPPGRIGPVASAIPIQDDGEDPANDEERDERIEHSDSRVDEVEEVDRQQPGRRRRPDGGGDRRRDRPQQPQPHRVGEGDGRGPEHRRGDAPADRVVAEECDARADQPLPERGMGTAGEVGDSADILGTDDVPARIAGVEDLVEDEVHRPSEAREAKDCGPEHDRDEQHRVEPRPAAGRCLLGSVMRDRHCLVILGTRPTRGAEHTLEVDTTMGMARTIAVVFGAVYLVAGLAGFILETPLFGLFEVNTLHNIVHVLLGAILLYAATSTPLAVMATRGVGGLLVVLAILGHPVPGRIWPRAAGWQRHLAARRVRRSAARGGLHCAERRGGGHRLGIGSSQETDEPGFEPGSSHALLVISLGLGPLTSLDPSRARFSSHSILAGWTSSPRQSR